VAQFTDIGHACREAIQRFISDLVTKHEPQDVESDPQTTIPRLKGVLRRADVSSTVAVLAEALLSYFGAVSDLVQRQEHGGQREGQALKWEDARRVVFQTLLVMYELDRELG
jgi:hypothetical protein